MALLDATLKVSLIVLVALAAIALLRKRSAAERHAVLAAAVLCAAALPLAALVVPAWSLPARLAPPTLVGNSQLPISNGQSALGLVDLGVGSWTLGVQSAPRPDASRSTPARAVSAGITSWITPIWGAGVALSLAILCVGLGRLTWIARQAVRVRTGAWVDEAAAVSARYGVRRRVTLLQSAHPAMLVTWGFLRPRVLLPAGAQLWDADRIRVVLCHELAHVRRGDWAVQMCGELLRCVFWFNPLVWIALMRLRDESEHACDDAVLNQGIEGREYAWQLLSVARGFTQRSGRWLPAPAIARTSSLERRIGAMLNGRIDRRPMTRGAVLAIAAAFALLTLPLAAAQPGPAALSGTVLDPVGIPVAGARLVLSSDATRVVQTQSTDDAGRFDFGELAAGEYLLQVRPPDFGRVSLSISLEPGRRVQRDITLELSGMNIATGIAFPPRPSRGRSSWPNDWTCLPDNPVLCGPPSLLEEFARDEEEYARSERRMRPARWRHRFDNLVYPDALRDSGVFGRVVVQGRIGTDGFPTGLRVASSVHPDLDDSALKSVREWSFIPARLNGVPVEVPLTATLEYVDGRSRVDVGGFVVAR